MIQTVFNHTVYANANSLASPDKYGAISLPLHM